jgi:RNA polymerase sigma factor (sigma-70 family)
MGSGQLSSVMRHIRKLAGMPGSRNQTDGQLLERFTVAQDEAAFETLLQRHGPMVLGVCRRLLANPHDAEDAFQATFLVLVCKAGSIAKRESAGSWLHGVAHRIALRAKVRTERQRTRTMPLADLPDEASADIPAVADRRELCAALDEELNRLPEKLRAPLVLFYLEGKSRHEAAQQLSWPEGTFQRWLARARELLHSRLVRRGLTLSAALSAAELSTSGATAAVPTVLTAATIKAAVLIAAGKGAAAGPVSAQAVALTKAALHALFLTKLKIATAFMLLVGFAGLGAGMVTQQVLAQRQSEVSTKAEMPRARSMNVAGNRLAQAEKTAPAIAPVPPDPGDKKTMSVDGRVLDMNGRPVANADVAVLGRPKDPLRTPRGDGQPGVALGQGKTDGEGHFRLTVRQTSKERFWAVTVFARKSGQALGWTEIDTDLEHAASEVRLPRERILRGRLIDLQGHAAANVKADIVRIVGPAPQRYRPLLKSDRPPGGLACLPEPVTTDAQGRFALRGLDGTLTVTIEVQDDRFARQELEIKPWDQDDRTETTFALAPARVLEGTVICADSGKPVPNARVRVQAHPEVQEYGRIYLAETRTDEQGRFQLFPHVGNTGGAARVPASILPPPPAATFTLTVYPPAGEPYLAVWKGFNWPKADVVKHRIDLSLPRGVVVRGTVTEAASSKPVAGAYVEFEPQYDNNPFYRNEIVRGQKSTSGPDGKFQLTVLPGPGHLLINGPSLDYVHIETTVKELYGGGVGPNRRNYPDALVTLILKPDADTHEVAVGLRRGVTLSGCLVGPDGKAVERAVMLCHSYIPHGFDFTQNSGKEVRDGQFELPGCDPLKKVEVYFLDPKNQLGAKVEISPGQISRAPITVQLQRCGSAKARFVREDGKPVADLWPVTELVLSPGEPMPQTFSAMHDKGPIADGVFLANVDPERHNGPKLRTDSDWRVTLLNLIPGARHWIDGDGFRGKFHAEFTVNAGEMLDLGEIKVLGAPPPKDSMPPRPPPATLKPSKQGKP